MKRLASLLVLVPLLLTAGTTRAARPVVRAPVPELATWNIAELDDVTQGWYFTGEALADQQREGAPWAAEHSVRHAVAPAEVQPAVSAAPAPIVNAARVAADVPTVPEPSMVSMLLVGLVLIFLSVGGDRQETFNS